MRGVAAQREAGDDLDLGLGGAGAFHVRIAELSGQPRGARFVSALVDEVNRLHHVMPNLRDHVSSADEVAEHEPTSSPSKAATRSGRTR